METGVGSSLEEFVDKIKSLLINYKGNYDKPKGTRVVQIICSKGQSAIGYMNELTKQKLWTAFEAGNVTIYLTTAETILNTPISKPKKAQNVFA